MRPRNLSQVLARTFTKEDAGPPSHPPAPVRPRAVPAGQEGAGDPVGVSADALNLHLGGVGGWFGGKDGKAGRAAPAPAPVGRGPAGMQAPGMAGGGEAAARRGARPHLEWIREGLAAQGLQLDRREEGEMELVFTFVLSYFDIVRKNLRDSLPKASHHHTLCAAVLCRLGRSCKCQPMPDECVFTGNDAPDGQPGQGEDPGRVAPTPLPGGADG